MTLPKDEVSQGLLNELEAFEALLRSLADADLDVPSRCDGWTAGDVARHVVGSMADVAAGRLEGLGSPEVTAREVAERHGRGAAELADELAGVTKSAADLLAVFDDEAWAAPAPGGYEGTLGDGVEALWYDAYIHADDIRAALEQESVISDGLRAAASHVAFELGKRGFGPNTLALDGLPTFPIQGGGPEITGPALAFILAATGRADAATVGFGPDLNIYRD